MPNRGLGSGAASGAPFLAALLIGLGIGAEADTIAYLTSRYFGLRAFGEIYGYAFCHLCSGGRVGSVADGAGFDHSPILIAFSWPLARSDS